MRYRCSALPTELSSQLGTALSCVHNFDGLSFVTVQLTSVIKASEMYLPLVMFTMLYEVVLTFAPVDEILRCDH